ncbi:putative nuclear RNA export factor SDE5 [Aristolochia californica]|uniref:putative nuclear RNA export factor SDE5 n=1 Tax=Aristolochia californica TaxID=171875 RepID=UPI0035D54260
MEVSFSSSNPISDTEEKALATLLDAFGTTFELGEIAGAYCRAGRNVDLAGDILYGLQDESSSTTDTSSSVKRHEKPTDIVKSSKGSKPRKVSASVGTVSNVIGKGYCSSTASENHSYKAKKIVKLEVRSPSTENLVSDAAESDFLPRNKPQNNKDIEDFLYKMLGDGFQLERDVIQDVLRCCGYDARKGMEKLLRMSSAKSNKTDDDLSKSAGSHSIVLQNAQSQNSGGRCRDEITREPPSIKNKYSDSAMDILNAWYKPIVIPNDDSPEETYKLSRIRQASHKIVSGHPDDTGSTSKILELQVEGAEEVKEDKYDTLRKASKVNWDAMKAYYEAAVDAFVNGEQDRVDYLIEQGKHFNEKAREADDKSAGKIHEIRSANASTVVSLDLHEQQTREAICLLKLQLSSFSGIPSIHFLKIIVDSGHDTITKGARRRLVIKLLEKQGIKWSEENAGTIKIKVDEIDPRKLTFAKNTGY